VLDLELAEKSSGDLICVRNDIVLPAASARSGAVSLEEIALSDMVIEDFEALTGFREIVERFLANRGVLTFVDYAYCYMLGRPADVDGLASYAAQINEGALGPMELLKALFTSSERLSSGWRPPSPVNPSFPFREN
jgi:hypothetical protein